MCSTAQRSASGEQPPPGQTASAGSQPSARRLRKQYLLPRITRLAREGYSGAAIAAQLGLPKRTVNHWLHPQRQAWAAQAAEDCEELMTAAQAQRNEIYCGAMEAWQTSKTALQVRLTERSETSGDEGQYHKTTTSLQIGPPQPKAAYLKLALEAAKATCELRVRPGLLHAQLPNRGAATAIPAETLKIGDLKPRTADEWRALKAGESITVLITLRRDGFSSRRSVMSTLENPTLIDSPVLKAKLLVAGRAASETVATAATAAKPDDPAPTAEAKRPADAAPPAPEVVTENGGNVSGTGMQRDSQGQRRGRTLPSLDLTFALYPVGVEPLVSAGFFEGDAPATDNGVSLLVVLKGRKKRSKNGTSQTGKNYIPARTRAGGRVVQRWP